MKSKLILFLIASLMIISFASAATEYTESHGVSYSAGNSVTGKSGIKINATQNISITKIGVAPSVTASTAYILDSSKNVLVSSTISGSVATFSSYPLNKGYLYYLVVDRGGSNYNQAFNNAGFPYTGSNVKWVTGLNPASGSDDSTYLHSISNVSFYNTSLFELVVTLVSPSDNTRLTTTGSNFTANYTVVGLNLTNATYFIWNNNGSLFNASVVSVTGNTSNTSTLFIDDFVLGQNYVWNVYACTINTTSTYCGFSLQNRSFYNTPFSDGDLTYNSSVVETSRQALRLNISASTSVSSVIGSLWYDNLSYTSSIADIGSGAYSATNTLDIPLINTNGNKSFWWEFTFTMNDGTILKQNSSQYNQTVQRTYLVLCNSTYNVQFVNFTTRNAENPFPILNASFKSSWQWYVSGGSGSVTRNYSFEDISETNSTFKFCMSPASSTYIIDSTLEYDKSGYSLNNYYLSDASLTNTTNAIDLYLLNESKATITTLKVRDYANNPKQDVYIQIQSYDVGTDRFYTVGMAKTSFLGQDIAYLNWYDTLYKFILIENGSIIKTTTPYKVSSTPQTFDIVDTIAFSFDKFKDFQYTLAFNNNTNNFVLTFTKPSGLVDQGCLRVVKRTGKNDTQICLSCETSSSATLYCNINNKGNGTYIGAFYATGSWDIIDWVTTTVGGTFASEIYDLIGKEDATAYAFLFSGIVVSMFLINPVLGIVGVIVSQIGAAALGFTLIDYSVFMGITLVGGIIIWLIKR